MANFVALIEPDPGIRARFAREVPGAIGHFPGMRVHDLACGDLVVAWAAHARAPVSSTVSADSAALVLGDAIDGPGSRRVTAAELAARTWAEDGDVPGPSDGYFVAVHYSARDGLRVWADVLGFFPVCYWSDAGSLLVASSPAMFRLHPRFRAGLSVEGLGGVLLTNGLVANTTPLAGVRRLAAGHVLVGSPRGGEPREREHYRIPLSHDLADLAFDDLLTEFDEILQRSCRRLAGGDGTASLLLSGGVDSRILAATGTRSGCKLTSVTFGKAGDQELRIARGVASTMSFPHHELDDSPTAPVEAAVAKARWEGLAAGFYRGTRWGFPAALADLPQPVLAGYALDFLAGPKRLHAERIARSGGDPFARGFERQSRWGIGPDNIDPLLRADGLSLSLQASLRGHLQGVSPHPAKAQWVQGLRHRARFHLGGVAWQIAMVSWPAFPALDRELLSFLGAMPMAALSGRRLEIDLIRTRFPDLAALPLDRNTPDTRPLDPRLRYLLAEALRSRVPALRSRDRLYYARLADLNDEAWCAVRHMAEDCRGLAERFMDPPTLARLLPPPDRRIEAKNVIVESNGKRLLLGALLWSREFLA